LFTPEPGVYYPWLAVYRNVQRSVRARAEAVTSHADPRRQAGRAVTEMFEDRSEQQVVLETVATAVPVDQLILDVPKLEGDGAAEQNIQIFERGSP
jgi:hypothetical protein